MSIRKSTFLKNYIKEERCGFVPETLLREDPIKAFEVAGNSVKPPSLFNVIHSVKSREENLKKKVDHVNGRRAISNFFHTIIS